MSSHVTFNVVQYNAFVRPYYVSHDGQMERMELIPEALSRLNEGDVDVITLNEIFFEVDCGVPITSPFHTEKLTRKMMDRFQQLGFPYNTQQVLPKPSRRGPFTLSLNGGVLIVSKWPIVETKSMVFRDSAGSSTLAAKGIVYAVIEKTIPGLNKTKRFHVFATHMQSWPSITDQAVRVKQAQQWSQFVQALNIPVMSEPVVFSGDLNIDMVLFPEEFNTFGNILKAELPKLIGAQRYTADPSSSILVGRDGAANYTDYQQSWGPKRVAKTEWCNRTAVYDPSPKYKHATTTKRYSSTSLGNPIWPFFRQNENDPAMYIAPGGVYARDVPFEWLDYVLYSKCHEQPIGEPTLECIPLKWHETFEIPWSGLAQPWAQPSCMGTKLRLRDLSDHYPVIGKFVFSA